MNSKRLTVTKNKQYTVMKVMCIWSISFFLQDTILYSTFFIPVIMWDDKMPSGWDGIRWMTAYCDVRLATADLWQDNEKKDYLLQKILESLSHDHTDDHGPGTRIRDQDHGIRNWLRPRLGISIGQVWGWDFITLSLRKRKDYELFIS